MKDLATLYKAMLIVTIIVPTLLSAQETIHHDTTKTYQLREVLIKGERLSLSGASSKEIILRNEIAQQPAASLSDVVSRYGGVFIKDYGGVAGVKTISQRGLGVEHSLILLNGMRISSIQNGLLDLGMFPLNAIEQVEILQGGFSSIVGADAVGGMVNIVTLPGVMEQSLNVTSSFSSFGGESYNFQGATTTGGLAIKAMYGTQREKSNFPFRFINGNTVYNLERENSDLSAAYMNLQSEISLSRTDDIQIVGYRYNSQRGVGGPVVGPVGESKARQSDEENIIQAHYRAMIGGEAAIVIKSQFHQLFNRYSDPLLNIGGVPLNNYFKNNEIRIEPVAMLTVDTTLLVTIGGEATGIMAEGNSINAVARRNQYASYLIGKKIIPLDMPLFQTITITPSLRYDWISKTGSLVNPGIELGLTLQPFELFSLKAMKTQLRANISRNFRAPTFNELYWGGGGGVGNPHLKPERALNVDAGAALSFPLYGEHTLRGTYYHISMTDRVIWVAAGVGSVTPKNIRSVQSTGIEASYRWNSTGGFVSFESNYTYGTTKKTGSEFPGDLNINNQLPYVPLEMLNLTLSLEKRFEGEVFSGAGMSLGRQFVGYRFTGEDNKSFLPGYDVTNASARISLLFGSLSTLMKFDALNIFEEEYQVMLAYPMPLRSYRFSVSLELQ